MTDACPLVFLVLFVFFDVVFGCETPPWVLKRADPGSSRVSFFNHTVDDSFVNLRWTWMDSSGGIWDTRLKVTTNDKEEIIGGGFSYFDRYEKELASVRWYKIQTNANGSIRWKHTSFESPPDSWWMTSVIPRGNITWGFKNQITDGSWVFRVGNDTLESKNIQNLDSWPQGVGYRRKRSLKLHESEVKTLRTQHLTEIKQDTED